MSQYVNEVSLPTRVDPLKGTAQQLPSAIVDIKADPKLGASEDGDWIQIGENVPVPVVAASSLPKPSRGLAEYIAQVRHTHCLKFSA